jgi:hypothetical protein
VAFCSTCGRGLSEGARFCASCGSSASAQSTPAAIPQPAPTQAGKGAVPWGWLLGVGIPGAIVLLLVVSCAMNYKDDSLANAVVYTPDPAQKVSSKSVGTTKFNTPMPAPTADRHAERVQYQDFWNTTVGNLAMVYVCVNYAAKAAAGNDNVEASRALEYGQKFADSAKQQTLSVPGDWNDNDNIGPRLFSAANSLSDAMGKMRGYLDDNKPSETAEAQDEAQQATADVEAATDAAQTSYVAMGGKASDLETMQSKVKSTVAALDSLMGGSDNQ